MCTLDKILNELKAQNLSQKALASYLIISKNAVSEWKSGRNEAYKKYLPQISKFLGVSVSYLTGETDIPAVLESSNVDDIAKQALFGQTQDVTDEMYNEVKQYAEMVMLREQVKQNKKDKL